MADITEYTAESVLMTEDQETDYGIVSDSNKRKYKPVVEAGAII